MLAHSLFSIGHVCRPCVKSLSWWLTSVTFDTYTSTHLDFLVAASAFVHMATNGTAVRHAVPKIPLAAGTLLRPHTCHCVGLVGAQDAHTVNVASAIWCWNTCRSAHKRTNVERFCAGHLGCLLFVVC